MALPGFLFGGSTGLSYNDLQDRRAAADALAKRLMGMQPKNTAEGIGAVLTGIGAGLGRRSANAGMREGQEKATSQLNDLFGRITGQPGAVAPSAASASNLPMPGAAAEMTASNPAPSSDMNAYRNAIASIESDGSGGYGAIGPTHPKMGRALGRYQIMESNIGPWSQEALGRAITPDEFMSDPKLQDAIFDKKFGGYVEKYGPEGAAQAWFAGPGGVGKLDRKDSLGTSVAAYGRKFNKAVGSGSPFAAIEAAAPGSGNIAPPAPDQPQFDAGRFGDPIKLSEMPAGMDDAGQRLSSQATAYAANPQAPMGGLSPLPSRDVAPAPQVATAPQQVAQNGPMQPPQMPQAQPFQMDPRVLQLLSNPFLDEGQRSALQLYARQQMQAQQQAQEEQTWRARQEYTQQQRQNDPAYKLGLEQTRAEIDRMNRPGYRMLTGDERKAYGIPDYDTRPYQMSRDGQVSAVGGMGQGQSAGVEATQREALAARYGIDPKSAEGQRFILTGTLPTSDRGVTAGDREAIRDADDQVQAATSVIDQLQSILAPGANGTPSLNDRAGYGATADWQSWAARNDPTGFFDDAKGEATTELNNTVIGQALGSLKSIFGAAPTEGERQILLDMQASVDKTPAERKIIIDKAIKLAQRRLQFNQDRAGDLRGGTYYKPDRGAPNVQTNTPRTPAEAMGLPPAPGNSAGPQPGTIEDGYRFRGGDPGNPANWEKVN